MESIDDELNNAFVTGIMNPLNYIKHENRDVIIKPVKRNIFPTNSLFVSCLNQVEHLKGKAELGLLMDPLKLTEYAKQHQNIRVAEGNVHPGHMFGYQ